MSEKQLNICRLNNTTSIPLSQINTLLDKDSQWDIEQGKKFLANHDNIFLLAVWSGEPVGFLTAHRLQRFDNRKAEVLLYEIGVRADQRRKGIGKALIEELKVWSKKVGADEIWVLTNQSNLEAKALYQSSGGNVPNQDDVMFTIKL